MASLIGAPPHALLEQPVYDADGRLLGRVGAVGSRHGVLQRIGVEGPEIGGLRFVRTERLTIERDRIVIPR
jgi:hypothetical protein